MDTLLPLTFANGHHATACHIHPSTDLHQALQHLQVCPPRPTLVIVGGASGLKPSYLDRLQVLFCQVLCPIMEQCQGVVVDGGTDAGVMKLMGQARYLTQSHFPLIGVAAKGTVCLPDAEPPPGDFAMLEPNHTHFLLVPGSLWGDEVPWIAQVAGAVAIEQPSLTVLINGGKIAWQDVANSVRVGRSVLVVAGSGRTADEIAVAIRGDRNNQRANALVDSGLLHCMELQDGIEALKQQVTALLLGSTTSQLG